MPHNMAFNQGVNCLLRLKQYSEKEIEFYLENVTCDPLIHIMDHPKFIVSNQNKDSISAKKGLQSRNGYDRTCIIHFFFNLPFLFVVNQGKKVL